MPLSYTAIKARDQTARPVEQEIMGRTRRSCGSRGTIRPLARKLLMLLVMEANTENPDSSLNIPFANTTISTFLFVKSSFLAGEEWKIVHDAPADPFGLEISGRDHKTRGNL